MKRKDDYNSTADEIEADPRRYVRRQSIKIYCGTRNEEIALRALELFYDTIRDELF